MSLFDRIDPHDVDPAGLWAALDADVREEAVRAVYRGSRDQGQARREADRAIAAALNFREVAVRKLPTERRIGYVLRSVRPDDQLASTLLMGLHLEERTALLSAFLDALGIEHEDGLIGDDEGAPPTPAALAEAVAAVSASFPADQVEVYLASLIAMDPETWGGLADAVRSAERG